MQPLTASNSALVIATALSFLPQLCRIASRDGDASGISLLYALLNLIVATELFAIAFCFVYETAAGSDFFVHNPVTVGDRLNIANLWVISISWFALSVHCYFSLPRGKR